MLFLLDRTMLWNQILTIVALFRADNSASGSFFQVCRPSARSSSSNGTPTHLEGNFRHLNSVLDTVFLAHHHKNALTQVRLSQTCELGFTESVLTDASHSIPSR